MAAPPRRQTIDLRDEAASQGGEPTESVRGPERASDRFGQVLHGYRLDAELGAGASSLVFRGHHQKLGHPAAIKVLRARFAGSDESRARMIREARLLFELQHPGVVRLYDFGLTQDGLPFMVTELVEGPSLEQYLKRPPPPAVVAQIGARIASGLAAMHERGIVHRDLKPANVILKDGDPNKVKIIDLGIAVEPDADLPLTRPDQVLGTPIYMAPEQVHRQSPVGPAADLYALGALLHKTLSGKPPFEGSVTEVLSAKLNRAPATLPGTGPLESLIVRMMARRPEERPTAKEVEAALGAPSGGPVAPPGWRPWARALLPWLSLALAIAAMVAALR